MSSKCHPSDHHKTINNLLLAVQKQKYIMEHLTRDLEYFLKMVQMRLEYDNGTPSYLTDVVNEAPDYDSYMYEYEEVGNGMIIEETVVSYLDYKSAMDNFQMGFEKSKDQIEKVWKDVNVVGVVTKGQIAKKQQLTREQF